MELRHRQSTGGNFSFKLRSRFGFLSLAMIVLCALGGVTEAFSQQKVTRDLLCSYYPVTFAPADLPAEITTFTSQDEAQAVVDEIVATVTGKSRRFEARSAPVLGNNAAAAICNENRYIFYGDEFMKAIIEETDSYWAAVSVVAHEIGHHFHGHTLDEHGSSPPIELEADHFSGFVLQKMGASLEEAKKAMRLIATPTGSSTHPPLDDRLTQIEIGWNDSCERDPACTPDSTGEVIEGAFGFKFTNECRYSVKLAIQYQDLTGEWRKAGWWHFSPGETAFLATGSRLMSTNSIWYYYAETIEGPSLHWGADHGVNFGGRFLEMKQMKDVNEVNDWTVVCEGK